jgi:hypothetical protein
MVSLLVGTCVTAEQDGFPEGLLCPSYRCGVDRRHRREVDGLFRLGLHGPSLVALRSQTAALASACLAGMIIFDVALSVLTQRDVRAIAARQHYCVGHALVHPQES